MKNALTLIRTVSESTDSSSLEFIRMSDFSIIITLSSSNVCCLSLILRQIGSTPAQIFINSQSGRF